MKLRVIAVGSVRGALAEAVAEYESRAARYWKLDVREVAAGARGGDPTPERARDAEADRILRALDPDVDLWALTRPGRALGSIELAAALERRAVESAPDLTFVVGGAFGLGRRVLDEARTHVALSRLTLPHDLARLVLFEQLYRAGTILRNEPYHKGA